MQTMRFWSSNKTLKGAASGERSHNRPVSFVLVELFQDLSLLKLSCYNHATFSKLANVQRSVAHAALQTLPSCIARQPLQFWAGLNLVKNFSRM